jgi:carboxypeptidase Taq
MTTNTDLKSIYSIQKELTLISRIESLLHWDMETYMPKKGVEYRSEQLATLSKIIHELLLDNNLWTILKRLTTPGVFKKLPKKDQIVVERFYKSVERSRKIPTEFVTKYTKLQALTAEKWKEARDKSKFAIFAPYLEKIIAFKKQEIKYVNLPGHPYNSLLDDYEEGMTVKQLKPIFEKLKPELIKLLRDIKSTKKYKNQKKVLRGKFPEAEQWDISNWIYSLIIPEKEISRLDKSTHPFTTSIGTRDVRLTTRFDETDPLSSFTPTAHEAGHALYELNLPKKYEYTTVRNGASFGLHESQSRFWENIVCRSEPFAKVLFSKFKKSFPKQMKGIKFNDFYHELNLVKPGLIRVDADEVTYCLHVILRFEIELALFEGKLTVKDLPKEWNKQMKNMLGVVPKTDTKGVLQDVHWSWGSFGYFPTYALGTMYTSQLFAQMKKDIRGLDGKFGKLQFKPIADWLEKHVHQYGDSMRADDIIKKACGKGLDVDTYVSYLRKKYSQIYGF